MKRQALFMALSSKVKDKELLVLDALNFETPKTKIATNTLKVLSTKLDGYRESKKKRDSILLIMPSQDKNITRAVNNLPFFETLSADSLNIKDVLAKKYMILLKEAIPIIEKTFRI